MSLPRILPRKEKPMRSNLFASGLAIVLGFAGVSAIGFPEVAIAQQQTSELDRFQS